MYVTIEHMFFVSDEKRAITLGDPYDKYIFATAMLEMLDYILRVCSKGTIHPGLRLMPSGNFFLALDRRHNVLLKKKS